MSSSRNPPIVSAQEPTSSMPRAFVAAQNTYYARTKATDPDYKPRVRTRGPNVWDEAYLTESWAERKARLAAERAAK